MVDGGVAGSDVRLKKKCVRVLNFMIMGGDSNLSDGALRLGGNGEL